MAVEIIIKLYNTAAIKMANMISINAFCDEKWNSSAAWGTLSKPTNAHGAIAMIEIIAANAVVSVGKYGCIFEIPELGCIPTIKVIATTPITIMLQKTNCIRPDKPVPLMLKKANIAKVTDAIIISGA